MRTRALMTPRGRVEEAEALKPGRAGGMVIVSARTMREMLPLATVVVVVAASVAEVVAVAMVSSIAEVVAAAAAVAVVEVARKGKPAAPPAGLSTEPHSIGGTRTTPTSSTQMLTTPGR